MDGPPDRRRFFKHIFSSVSDLAATVLPTERDPDAGTPGACETAGLPPEIMADLTDELLAVEASRLGLDPHKDHHRILESIQKAMSNRAEG